MKLISKDTPLAELTLRKYEKPGNMQGRQLVRKLCLSLGMLQPGDSRDVIVDILYVILNANKGIRFEDIEKGVIDLRKKNSLPMVGIASSNIRRQVRRLKGVMLIEKSANDYRISENSTISQIYEEKIEKFLLSSISERIKEYAHKVDDKNNLK